ncbi:MAG: hypothetical protein R6X07_12420 [Desulfatiglandales bacterium]
MVGTTEVKIVTVTYTGEGEFWFDYLLESNSCGFTAKGSRFTKLDAVQSSTDITVSYAPLEPGPCEANLQLLNLALRAVAAQVTLTGNGIAEVQKQEIFGMTNLLDAFNAWVAAGEIIGKGPGKSADNRLNAFRNMLVEAEVLVGQSRNAEAYGQLMTARKKIGEFIMDSKGLAPEVSLASASNSTSATSSLLGLINQVLESLMQ